MKSVSYSVRICMYLLSMTTKRAKWTILDLLRTSQTWGIHLVSNSAANCLSFAWLSGSCFRGRVALRMFGVSCTVVPPDRWGVEMTSCPGDGRKTPLRADTLDRIRHGSRPVLRRPDREGQPSLLKWDPW